MINKTKKKKIKNKKMKTNKGITLIALVITIIVLLILAGITIGSLTSDNGVIKNAKDAKNQTEVSSLKEQIELAIIQAEKKVTNPTMRDVIESLIKNDIIADSSKVDEETGTITTKEPSYLIEGMLDDYIVKKLQPGKKATSTEKDNYTDGTESATIPKDFTISSTDYTISTGLVVIGPDGSEFVWVPVRDINEMSQCQVEDGTCHLELNSEGKLNCSTHNSVKIVGKLYWDIDKWCYSQPKEASDSSDVLFEPGDTSSNGVVHSDCVEDVDLLEEEYKVMVQSVQKYGGFYIGRYEMSLNLASSEGAESGGSAQSKSGVIPISADQISQSWYELYKKAKTYKTGSVQSQMIWGSQYDAMLNWVKNGNGVDKDKVAISDIGGNYSGKVTETGNASYQNDSINHIRDLGGNLKEWTAERADIVLGSYADVAAYNVSRTPRGGSFDSRVASEFRSRL